MRISVLQRREPFGAIFELTLSKFLTVQHGVPHIVKWRPRGEGRHFAAQEWLCNPYLNVIFRPDVEREPLLPTRYEFSRAARPSRAPLNLVYSWLATSRLTSRLLSTATIDIDPPLSNSGQMVIIGGNHHLRLLDYHRRCCFVIEKSGSLSGFLANELSVRRSFGYLPSPAILDSDPSNGWYSEELILGTPINRLKDQQIASQAVRQVIEPLFTMYRETERVWSRGHYCLEVADRIRALIKKNTLLDSRSRDILTNALPRLLGAARADDTVVTCLAHGDFQSANILAGTGGPWLIDWEYTSRRQTGYDGLVFALGTRQPKELPRKVKQALDRTLSDEGMLANWPRIAWQDTAERKATLALFFLEELEGKLRENDNPYFTVLDDGLQIFVKNLEAILVLLSD